MLTSQANHPWNWAPHFGAEWMDAQGKSVLAQDPAGQEMYRWQQELVVERDGDFAKSPSRSCPGDRKGGRRGGRKSGG
ncbi:hypothetical protein ACWDKQ_34730, partial [Saccharopolyspora sp. NPDC000995]